jgi:hypothetical protein
MNKAILLLLSYANKLLLIIFFLALLILSFVHFNIFGLKNQIYQKYPNLELRHYLFNKYPHFLKEISNDYSVKFLPETQFVDLNLKKKKLNFLPKNEKSFFKTFYIENIKDKLWIIDVGGNFFEILVEDFMNTKEEENFNPKVISSNLIAKKVLGTLVHNEKIFISYYIQQNQCKKLKVSFAKINNNFLDFKNLFVTEECGKNDIYGGKMQFFKHNKSKGILLTTADIVRDDLNNKAQEDDSIFGKILFINFETKKYIVYSKGHRNAAGLYSKDNLVISTEHGPKAGDEINKIIFGKNYGWPVASYGEKYKQDKNDIPAYHKNHFSLGFEEPLFSFIPALGISEIIKIPDGFTNFWSNNFFVSSLWGQSLHRIKFDESFSKVIFNEKIFIGERIRDLKYNKNMNAIILALEENGELGILKKKID